MSGVDTKLHKYQIEKVIRCKLADPLMTNVEIARELGLPISVVGHGIESVGKYFNWDDRYENFDEVEPYLLDNVRAKIIERMIELLQSDSKISLGALSNAYKSIFEAHRLITGASTQNHAISISGIISEIHGERKRKKKKK